MPRPSVSDEEYFYWLCSCIDIGGRDIGRLTLARDLHSIPFTWTIPNDDNRAQDGKELRDTFASESPFTEPTENGNASVLEVLVALAVRIDGLLAETNTQRNVGVWFDEMISNLGLVIPDDNKISMIDTIMIRANNNVIVGDFLVRKYHSNGKGGLFPLKNSKQDQRNVEIWYQMMSYLEENHKI